MKKVKITLKTGEQLIASCSDKHNPKHNILNGHRISGRSGLVWNGLDGVKFISRDQIRKITES